MIIDTPSKYRTNRNGSTKYLSSSFSIMAVYPVIFGTNTGRNTEFIPKALVVLQEHRQIIATVVTSNMRLVQHVFICYPRGHLRPTLPTFVKLIIQKIVIVLIGCIRLLLSKITIHPLVDILNILRQFIIHQPINQITVIRRSSTRKELIKHANRCIHTGIQITSQDRQNNRFQCTVITIFDLKSSSYNGFPLYIHILHNGIKSRTFSRTRNTVISKIKTTFHTMCHPLLRIDKIKERIYMERFAFTTHISKRRWTICLLGRTPNKEITIFIT
ncbi:hypothetical protein EVA_14351 [gut metagenome]|uniref:Uncharacterized protein n=1 Tax=gut metagenome TaxID=749906 RepID=J9CCA8_9ZZZZ